MLLLGAGVDVAGPDHEHTVDDRRARQIRRLPEQPAQQGRVEIVQIRRGARDVAEATDGENGLGDELEALMAPNELGQAARQVVVAPDPGANASRPSSRMMLHTTAPRAGAESSTANSE